MKRLSIHVFPLFFYMSVLVLSSLAQQTSHSGAAACPRSLAWMLSYTAPNGRSDDDNERLVALPCFRTALEKAFPTAPSFMGKHFQLSSTALHFVRTYGAGPQSSANRYVTVTGCLPHDCPNQGMIWIDTEGTGQIVFAASYDIPANGDVYSDFYHLWLYSSAPIPENQVLPDPLLASIQEVFQREKFVSATIVDPDGKMSAALPTTLHLNHLQLPSAK